ncbi:MAG TPA: bifunctional [glutamate--ammonia ligase]-adenylyl-L-tyrosine phosphorylase/[glutamate--ammonia-ligase] adenylyltransferase, partial [Burkholderiales bacterium]|nr:bifunctional [glutamate--ammonia ligase]-adenylyl-L-tyrosine phosphorylase/[glutamate--ammonia-ligase] adenylyltransferase [Burkholderiales bacterium]
LLASGDLSRVIAAQELDRRLRHSLRDIADRAELKRRLRAFRRRETARIAFRDLGGLADLGEVIETMSALADASIAVSLECLHAWAVEQSGAPMDESASREAGFVVLGMGKLGGRELNFSSDVDLIFAYSEDGETRGARRVSNQEFFLALGQSLIDVLADVTADGFVFRVDMRLRPNGASGPLVLSFDATEQYYQTHGRDWERYALIKARVVGGDAVAGEELLTTLRPFVFRKYLDYGALDAIRDMKGLIERDIARKGMREHVKLGPGGIREIEFIGQALQLIRAGREPPLQSRPILATLERLCERGYLPLAARDELAAAYVFLRNLEHRLQMVADQQTHVLPGDPLEQTRIAFAMGFEDWAAFSAALERQRERVRAHFTQTFILPDTEMNKGAAGEVASVWAGTLDDEAAQRVLRGTGFADGAAAFELLHGFRCSASVQALSVDGRVRLDRLMPQAIAAAGTAADANATLARVVHLLEAIGRRTTYFVMLAESPTALMQLVKLCAASEWIARWIARHPIVLDELLDPRTLYELPDRAALASELRLRMASLPPEDVELQMEVLREFHHSHLLRVAAADIGPGMAPERVGAQLSTIADVVLDESLTSATQLLNARHGRPGCSGREQPPGFAVIGYGKLGSCELGYASDLDMIFLYEGCEDGATDGKRSVPNEEFFARLGQRVIHLITTRTPSGVLYDVDMRLRPSGQSGTLVTSLTAFRDYQLNRAWTWEHQALVRARAVAGAPRLREVFAEIRREVLCLPRGVDKLKHDVLDMRERMLAGHPAPAAGFNLKHSRGGIVDIEFMVQYWILRWAHTHPVLTRHTDNINILDALQAEGLLEAERAEFLADAYRRYLSMEHRLKLAERGSVTDLGALGELPRRIRTVWDRTFND